MPTTSPRGDGSAADRARVPRTRVIVADADPLARRALRDVLQDEAGCTVVADVPDGVALVELAVHYRPDVVLTEVHLLRLNGIPAIKRILEHAPAIHVLVVTAGEDRAVELAALRAGAAGFVSKHAGLDGIGPALHAVLRGDAAVSPALAMGLIELLRLAPQGGTGMRPVRSSLTQREWEVLDLLIVGLGTVEMAARLVVEESTVRSHVKSLMRKLGVHTRADAVRAGAALGTANGHGRSTSPEPELPGRGQRRRSKTRR